MRVKRKVLDALGRNFEKEHDSGQLLVGASKKKNPFERSDPKIL